MDTKYYQSLFETYLLTEKRVTQNTFTAYQTDISQLCDFLTDQELAVGSATRDDLRLYVREMHKKKLSARTMSRKISSIKLFYGFLHERHQVDDVSKVLVFPKVEKKLPMYLTEKEVVDLLDAARKDESPKGVRNLVMIHLLYAAGMRISELTNLTLNQFHFDTGFLTVSGKGNKQRDVPLPQKVLQTVSYYLDAIYPRLVPQEYLSKAKPYLFATVRNGKLSPLSRQSFWVILRKLLTAAKITKSVSPHTLRHSLATHLMNAGADIRSLQLLLGHEQINTVEIYTHLENKQLRKIYDNKHPRA